MPIAVEELTPSAFAPFGDVLGEPGRAPDASGPGWRWWAELAQLTHADRPQAVGYLRLEPAPLRFDWAERHHRTAELVVPLERECLLYAAPRGEAALPDRESFRAFRVEPGQGAALGPGVWHGAPLATEPTSALVFLLAGTGTDDTEVARFADDPVDITT